jgi:hypothetical protein
MNKGKLRRGHQRGKLGTNEDVTIGTNRRRYFKKEGSAN